MGRTIDQTRQGRLGGVPLKDLIFSSEDPNHIITRCENLILRYRDMGSLTDTERDLLSDVANLLHQLRVEYNNLTNQRKD